MKRNDIIQGFSQLGRVMICLGNKEVWPGFSIGVTQSEYDELNALILQQKSQNGWFTEDNVRMALASLGRLLTRDQLSDWSRVYPFSDKPKRIGLIMAGNIPLVGFHDLLCTIVSGHVAMCKLSSNDQTLLPAFSRILTGFVPELKEFIEFSNGRIGGFDAVIATGSNNSLRYFEQYFGKYPHIFRKNRTSVAVIQGGESMKDFERLGEDVFSYFGLGCRNVSHLIVPHDFSMDRFFEGIVGYGQIIHHHKYGNNYDYNKAVYLMNQHQLLDNHFVLLYESHELFSQLAMIHYHRYKKEVEISDYLNEHAEDIQVVLGHGYVPFGEAQHPQLDDYADGVNTMEWMASL